MAPPSALQHGDSDLKLLWLLLPPALDLQGALWWSSPTHKVHPMVESVQQPWYSRLLVDALPQGFCLEDVEKLMIAFKEAVRWRREVTPAVSCEFQARNMAQLFLPRYRLTKRSYVSPVSKGKTKRAGHGAEDEGTIFISQNHQKQKQRNLQ